MPIESVLEFLWAQSWQISFAVIGVGAVCIALRRASAHWRYLLWLVVLVKCLVPPIWSISLFEVPETWRGVGRPPMSATEPSERETTGGAVMTATKPNVDQSRSDAKEVGIFGMATTASHWQGMARALVVLWALASVGYLLWALVKGWRIQRDLTAHRTFPDLELECEFVEMVQALGIRSRPRLCLIRGISQPFVWGVLRGCIYLPERFSREGSSRERKLILCHELAHVLRWDAMLNVLQIIVQAIFIFHPFVWWMNRQIRQEREKSCDEIAIAGLNVSPRTYASTIIERLAAYFEPAAPSSSLAVSGEYKEIEDRVKTILSENRIFRRRPSWLMTISCVILGALWIPAGMSPISNLAKAETERNRATFVDLAPEDGVTLSEVGMDGVPSGVVTMGSVPFRLSDHGLDLGGNEAQGGMVVSPEKPFARLHLLHATLDEAEETSIVARIVVRYADGANLSWPIRYGTHVRKSRFAEFRAVRDAHSSMAWTGTTLASRARNEALRLYRSSWKNPHPDKEVDLVRIENRDNQCRALIVAMTLE